jgi:heme/copper-type cytochrome/quinol oxidase subunit 2
MYLRSKNLFSFMLITVIYFIVTSINVVFAEEPKGIAKDWGVNLQTPFTEVAKDVFDMHSFVTIIMALITLFVLGLLIWVCYRYSEAKKQKTI